jgi:hypothetical protein
MSSINKEIQELENQIAKLKKEQEVQANNEFNKVFSLELQGLADNLHSKLCRHNHTDGCDYFYYKWTSNSLGYARQREIERINRLMLAGLTVEQIKTFIANI